MYTLDRIVGVVILVVPCVSSCAGSTSSSDETGTSTSSSPDTSTSAAATASSDTSDGLDTSASVDSSSTGAPIPTGACDGPATDDYWLCLMDLPMGDGGANIGTQFRSASEIAAAGGGVNVTYCWSGNTESDGSGTACTADDYANKQNAAKVLIPAGQHSIQGQPRPAIDKRDGDILVTWDSWNAPEWYLGRSCADGGSIGAQKTFQVSAPPEGNASRWIEVRQLYSGASHLDGTVPGWDPVTSATEGTHIASVDARSYGTLGAAAVADGDALAGQIADFAIVKSTWTRYWVLVEIDQGDAWTCGGVEGSYDFLSIWLADEDQAPVQLFDRAEVETTRVIGLDAMGCDGDEALDDPPTDAVLALWFEYNSSEGNCADGGLSDRIGYFRNFAALHTPMPEGVVVASASSLLVADTEILIQPRP